MVRHLEWRIGIWSYTTGLVGGVVGSVGTAGAEGRSAVGMEAVGVSVVGIGDAGITGAGVAVAVAIGTSPILLKLSCTTAIPTNPTKYIRIKHKIADSLPLVTFSTPSEYFHSQYKPTIGMIMSQTVGISAPSLFISRFVFTYQIIPYIPKVTIVNNATVIGLLFSIMVPFLLAYGKTIPLSVWLNIIASAFV